MTLTPAELARMADARSLLDAIVRAARLDLTPLQAQAALTEIELALAGLRSEWIAADRVALLAELREVLR